MKMNNNKGITMLSLVIVVILMILLASITAYESNELISIARVQSVTTDLLLIQAKVRIINEKVVFENDEEEKSKLFVGTMLFAEHHVFIEMCDNNIITEEESKNNEYYLLSKEDLINMGLDGIDISDDEKIVVDYEHEEVIYVKGVKNTAGQYLYKLSEMNP